MAGNSAPLIDQAYTFPGDASTANTSSFILLPEFLNGHYVELIVYALFDHTSAAGKVTIQTAPKGYTGTWAKVGSDISWTAIDKAEYGAVSGVFASIRVAITTTVTSGTVSLYVVANSK